MKRSRHLSKNGSINVSRMSLEPCVVFNQFTRIVPCLQPDSLKEAPFAAAAMIVMGNIAIARYTLFSAV